MAKLQENDVHFKIADSVGIISPDLLISGLGVFLILVVLRMAFRLPQPTEFQGLVLRVMLALSAAAIATGIPGFISVQIGAGIRAGGALAVFLLVYAFNPPALLHTTKRERPPESKSPV